MRVCSNGTPLKVLVAAAIAVATVIASDNEPPSSDALNIHPKCEIAVLRNGFSLQCKRHEEIGAVTRLSLCGAAGFVEVPTAQIARFEEGDDTDAVAADREPDRAPSGLQPRTEIVRALISGAASRYQIDPDFIASVVKVESAFNPKAISSKGALGLMQLMPQTAAAMRVDDALDAAENLEGGTRYLRRLLDQYGGDAVKALAAYNAGPLRVKQYRGVPPYPETYTYIKRIIEDFNRRKLSDPPGSEALASSK
jgi:hypothetical protein